MGSLSRFVPLVLVLLLFATTEARAGTLKGRVVDPDGRPVAGARVLLAEPIGVGAATTTGADGTFRLENVDAGRYEVVVVVPGFQAEPFTVTLTKDEEREATISLRLSGISESVVVSAAQVDIPLSRATGSVMVISGAEMAARQTETTGDALRSVSGFSVARNGGRGAVTSLFPRGGESDFTLVLVDGIAVNAFGGGMDFSGLPLAGIDRIEVVRGPQSAVFGSDAIGGVVQVVTRNGGPPSVEGSIDRGSFSTTRATVSAAGTAGRWSIGGAAARASSGGFTGIAQATGERVTNDDWLAYEGSFTARWHGENGTNLRGNAAVSRSERGFPGPFGSNPVGAYTAVDRVSRGVNHTRRAGVAFARPLEWGGLRVQPRFQASWFEGDSSYESLFGLSDSGSRRVSGRIQADLLPAWPVRISAGAEVKSERATSTFITGEGTSPVPVRRRIVGAFLEWAWQPDAPVSLTAGIRLEDIRREKLEASPSPFVERPPFDADRLISANPKASFAWRVADGSRADATGEGRTLPFGLTVRGAAGTGIRPPDALEIAFTDNPGLRPERSRSAEAGLEADLGGSAAPVAVAVTAFYNGYDDLIVAVGPALGDASRFRTDNISNARTRGIELSSALRTRWGLHARLAYTFLDSSILAVDRGRGQAPPPFSPGDWLLRRPRHQLSVDAVVARGRFTAFAEVGARGRTLDVEPSWGASGGLFWNTGHAAANAGVGLKVLRSVELVARVTNLLDRRYEETFGFPAEPRSFTAGVRFAASR
ncbi:MAG: TonB-dependent receptor domain-containing protein [Vicinamibacterales bacterium]